MKAAQTVNVSDKTNVKVLNLDMKFLTKQNKLSSPCLPPGDADLSWMQAVPFPEFPIMVILVDLHQ